MTRPGRGEAGGEPLSRAFYDIAQVLESAEDAEARVMRVLERLRSLVPYERCAVLEAQPGRERRLLTAPGTPPAEQAELTATITALLGRLVEEHGQATAVPLTATDAHLAVPLVGLDEVIGVLYVRGAEGPYEERHVRALSIVASKLAAYFTMVRACALEAERTLEIEEARQAAETANRAKDEFLALVSHELRTPLSTILAWADALRSKETGEAERTRAFEAIERSVRAQAKLIDDLLDLSCVATATLRLDLRSVEPAKVIKAALRALRPRAEQKSIRLQAVLDESVMPLIADPHRLGQVVANLVANAIKFTPSGGRVEVRLERAGVLARIRVIDSGSGIRPEVLPHLFEPFRQADSSSTRAHGGLGVGLALVKDLVELHGGHVRAESPGEEKGATFTVELPLAGAAPEAPAPPGAPEGGRRDERALAGIRVLIVDDDTDLREVLRLVLEGQGAVVTLAGSPAEALAALEHSMPDVLLSDVSMPGESDYDLMRKIVAREGEGARSAGALAGYATGGGLQQALASGFRMQLAKPVDPRTLIAAVAALAGRTAGNDSRAARPA
jgi:signal transduction histidine kinase/ActR/RegA family two-component response regulator